MPGLVEAPTVCGGGTGVGGGTTRGGGWSSNGDQVNTATVSTTWSGPDDESGIEDSPVDGLDGSHPSSGGQQHHGSPSFTTSTCGNGVGPTHAQQQLHSDPPGVGSYERRPSLQRGSRPHRSVHAQELHSGPTETRSTSAPPHVHHSVTLALSPPEHEHQDWNHHLPPHIHVTQDASQAEVSIDESAPHNTTLELLQESQDQVTIKSQSRDSPSKNEHKKHVQLGPSDGLQTAEALPTDMSDSTESEKENKPIGSASETVICPVISTHHIGKEVINAVFNLPVDTVFTLLFTNSTFMLDLYAARKTFDVVASPWQSNNETNQKLRQVTYTLTLPPNSFGPKVSHVTETQVLSEFSKPGDMYTVDAEACNAGIPYADSFFVSNHWCLTRESNNETRISVWTQVKYKKSVWGFMKGVIDKNSYAGVESMLADINSALLAEADRNNQKRTRRRRRVRGGSKADTVEINPPNKDTLHHKDHHHHHHHHTKARAPLAPTRKMTLPSIHVDTSSGISEGPVRVVVATLVVLLTLNALLYYKLWDLEDKLHLQPGNINPYATIDPKMFRSTSGHIGPVEEWVRMLQQQEALHAAEVDRWRLSIEEAAGFLRKAEEALRGLHTSIPENQASKAQILLMQLRKLQELEKSYQKATGTNFHETSSELHCPTDPNKPPDDSSSNNVNNIEKADGQEL